MDKSGYQLLTDCANILDEAVTFFTHQLPNAALQNGPFPHYRHTQTDVRIFALTRCVRIVSAIRATLVLLEKGFIQEAGVLIRTVMEFTHDLDFAVDAFINKDKAGPFKRRLEGFFAEELPTSASILEESKKPKATPRKKVYAAVARLFGGENPFRTRQVSKGLEEIYSGYVHGNYAHVMELYDGATHRLRTHGVPERIDNWLQYLALAVHPTLNIFSTVASALGLEDLMKLLIDQRKILEESNVYNRG